MQELQNLAQHDAEHCLIQLVGHCHESDQGGNPMVGDRRIAGQSFRPRRPIEITTMEQQEKAGKAKNKEQRYGDNRERSHHAGL